MKRKLLITLFSSLALILGGAIAQDAEKKAGKKRPGPAERATKMLEAADKDGDKKLSLEELTAHFEAMAARGPKGKRPGGKPGAKPGEKKPTTN